jgi:hypothetical protein
LHFRRLHTGYWIANADGSTEDRLGEPSYVVRTTPALLTQHASEPWRAWRAESLDGYIIAAGVTLRHAKSLCEDDTEVAAA